MVEQEGGFQTWTLTRSPMFCLQGPVGPAGAPGFPGSPGSKVCTAALSSVLMW